ncbi:MAG: hypothetical protein ACOC0J_00745 [Myxococcota bacterium]
MALSDYYLCDVCGEKCFYDANLNWELDRKTGTMSLERMGDMAAICKDCASKYEIVIRNKSNSSKEAKA